MTDTDSNSSSSETERSDRSERSLKTFNERNLQLLQSQNQFLQQIPELPSSKFQFSLWHDLKDIKIKGKQLKAPRIRVGPQDKDLEYESSSSDDSDVESPYHNLGGKAKLKHRDKLEKWEKAELASFGYQELQNGYQKKNLNRVLGRLKIVKHLNLAHNEISNISSFSFSKCEYLNLNNNFIASFKCLPKVSRIKHLTLIENCITELDGLKCLRSTPIEELYLNGNPVTFTTGYRKRVFSILPKLQVLDGVYQLKTDTEPMEENEAPKSCSVS